MAKKTKLTEAEAVKRLKVEQSRANIASPKQDPEGAHAEADAILVEFLRAKGFNKIADAYEAVQPKWYA